MRYIKVFRILAAALTISLLAVALPVTPALAAANIDVRPHQGEISASINIYGYGFSANQSVRIYFSPYLASVGTYIHNEVDVYKLVLSITADNYGEIDGDFTVPDELTEGTTDEKVQGGTYYVYATSTSRLIRAVKEFTVVSVAEITLVPVEGVVGAEFKVSGTGFATSQSVTIKFDNTEVGTAQTNSAGSFTNATFTVPESYRGSHTIEAKDVSNNSDTATFTTKQSAAITPTSGIAGDTLTISGTGFQASQSITITFGGVEAGEATSDAKGSFSTSFTVPVRSAGTYKVDASDGIYMDSADFAISASMSISQTIGYVGDEVTISGTGFQASQQMPVIFDNDLVATVSTDNNGRFGASFTVPARAAGTYKVIVNDGINFAEANFSIATSASINPTTSPASPGHVGAAITVSGVGFIAGRTVTVTYDVSQVATATVLADGTFSATFNAPASRGGGHTIIASDLMNTKQFTFVMESTPPVTPPPLKPEMGIKAEAAAYFAWEEVTDPSGVTYTLQIATDENFSAGSIVLEQTGLTQSEYTLTEEERLESVSKDAPYYWHVRAIDGASNESPWSGTGSFYVGFFLALSQPLIYTLLGIGALLFGIFGFWLGRKTAYF